MLDDADIKGIERGQPRTRNPGPSWLAIDAPSGSRVAGFPSPFTWTDADLSQEEVLGGVYASDAGEKPYLLCSSSWPGPATRSSSPLFKVTEHEALGQDVDEGTDSGGIKLAVGFAHQNF